MSKSLSGIDRLRLWFHDPDTFDPIILEEAEEILSIIDNIDDFKYQFGDLVYLDPTGRQKSPMGKIVARTKFMDGAKGYIVSVAPIIGSDTIKRHTVSEVEIRPVEPESN